MDEVSIGERIRSLRKNMGISQEELAEAVGVSVKHISKIERDEVSFSVGILQRLSEFFKVSSDYIVNGDGRELSVNEIVAWIYKEIYKEKGKNNVVGNI